MQAIKLARRHLPGYVIAAFVGVGVSQLLPNRTVVQRVPINDEQFLKDQIKSFRSNFEWIRDFIPPNIKVNVEKHRSHQVSFMINTDDNFDHMKFFHDILMAFNSLKTSSTKIDNTNRVIEKDTVSYVLQYSYIDKDNDKITSKFLITGNTKKNNYKIVIEKDSKFEDVEMALIFFISRTNRPEDEVTFLKGLPRIGCSVTEANNTPSLDDSFGSKELEIKVNKVLSVQSPIGAYFFE